MLPEAAGRGQHFQVRGYSFSLYGPTLSRQITYLFFSCDKLAYNWVYETFLLIWFTCRDLPCDLKVNRGKLALINRPWKCKKGKD